MMPGMMISLTGVGMECYFDYQIVHRVLWVSSQLSACLSHLGLFVQRRTEGTV